MTVNMLSRFQGCLMGVLIGDAMGMPVESMTHEEIMAATDGKGITGFVDPIQTTIKSLTHLQAGETTDDWQLTSAIARSIIRWGGYRQADSAKEQIFEMDHCNFGWGRTTKKGLEEIRLYRKSGPSEGRAPNVWPAPVGPGKGCGNGVAMKIAPIALFYSAENNLEKLFEVIMQEGCLTHPDVRASIAAYLLAEIISRAVTEKFEHVCCDTQQDLDSILLPYVHTINWIESKVDKEILCPSVSSKFRHSFDREVLIDISSLRQVVGTSCYAIESVPFSIGVFLRHANDFRAGVLEAVNAGGDTDTNASMVGAMIGANVGIEGIPEEWKNFKIEYEEALLLGEQLFEAAQKIQK